jgi:hypothetical protein
MLSPEARRRAQEIAAAAPPFSAAIREQIRLIMWGSVAPNSMQAEQVERAEPVVEKADAA